MITQERLQNFVDLRLRYDKALREMEALEREIVELLAKGGEELLVGKVEAYLSLAGVGENRRKVIEAVKSYAPTGSEELAKAVWRRIVKTHEIPQYPSVIAKEIDTLKDELAKELLDGFVRELFGGWPSEEDEKVAEEQLQKAVMSARTQDEVADAFYRAVIVKTLRRLSDGVNADVNSALLDELHKYFNVEARKFVKASLEADIKKVLKKGKDRMATLLLEVYLLLKGVRGEKAKDVIEKALPVLRKTLDVSLVDELVR